MGRTRQGAALRVAMLGLALAAGLALVPGPARALELISTEEAARPEPKDSGTRGITRGPTITQELPGDGPLRSPLQLKLLFKARGGARIDTSSVQLTYLKSPMVDLTPRLKAGISERGVQMDGLTLPPGLHRIQVRVLDSDGRESERLVQLNVAP